MEGLELSAFHLRKLLNLRSNVVLQGFCKTLYQAFCHMTTDCIHCPVNLVMKALAKHSSGNTCVREIFGRSGFFQV